MLCEKCKGQMRQVDSMNSGNSKFITYQCDSCYNRTTKCEGLKFL
ncbi:MAG: hypothetical protein ABIE94_02260 [archaeon]